MKKLLLIVLMLSLVAGVATVWATVIGTPHDLAPEPCAMCHTPHSGTGQYPLWNRTQTGTTGYTLYNSSSFDMGAAVTPEAPTALCLVCHNGIQSELVNYPGPCSNPDSAYDIQVAGCASLGENLQDDHPVSFKYLGGMTGAAGEDQDMNNFPTTSNTLGSNPRQYIPSARDTSVKYFLYRHADTLTNYFECATCHSVHDLATYDGKGDYQVYFLRSDNTGSAMCIDCHQLR